MENQYDYKNKMVYVGVDVHKKNYSVVCACDDEVIKHWSMEARPEVLAEQLIKYFAGAIIITAYEAGFAGFVLHRKLTEAGITNKVINAASVEVSSRDRVKTDKRDAIKLAVQLSSNRLTEIRVPTEQEELDRLLSRGRHSLIEERVRIGQQIKSKLYQFGLIDRDDDRKMNLKWINELKKSNFAHELKILLTAQINVWLEIDSNINELEKHLEEQAQKDHQQPLEEIYRSVPGIGFVTSRVLANELGDMKHFSSEKKLFSFTGLTPQEHSSGEKRRLGHITRCGRSIIRKMLIESAWRAIKIDDSLLKIFERISGKAGKKRAIVAIARKLAGRIRSCFLTGELYNTKAI